VRRQPEVLTELTEMKAKSAQTIDLAREIALYESWLYTTATIALAFVGIAVVMVVAVCMIQNNTDAKPRRFTNESATQNEAVAKDQLQNNIEQNSEKHTEESAPMKEAAAKTESTPEELAKDSLEEPEKNSEEAAK